jgi:hypothetical protein
MAPWVWLFLLWLPVLALILWDACDKEEIKKRAISDPAALFTAFLAVFTGILCVIGALQWQILKTTDDTLWANERPWLGVKPKVELGVVEVDVDDDLRSVSIDAKVAFNNYGNLPATNAAIATTVFVVPKSSDPANKGVPPSNYESAVASIEELKRSRVDLCQQAENFERGNVHNHRIDYPLSITNAPSIFPKESSDIDVSQLIFLSEGVMHAGSFTIAGCLHYSFGESEARAGNTFFVLSVSPEDPNESGVDLRETAKAFLADRLGKPLSQRRMIISSLPRSAADNTIGPALRLLRK